MDLILIVEEPVQVALDLIGVFVFALSGGLLAVRKGFDVVGIAVLAVLTALGGGLLRDLIIGDVPPAAFTQTAYLAVPLAAAVVVFVGHAFLQKLNRAVLVFDAAGLGLFAVSGTLKASAFGLGPLQAAVLGTVSAVGGGLLRDVVARETPLLLRPDSTLYSVPAFAGAGLVVSLIAAGIYHPLLGAVVVLIVFGWRLAAMRFRWRAPVAYGQPRRLPD